MDLAFIEPFFNTRLLLIIMIVLGYGLQFIPNKTKKQIQNLIITMPAPMIAITLLVIIQIIIQLKTENVQPFIYFQF